MIFTIFNYIAIKNISDCKSMYFIIGKVDRHIEERNGNKYLVFDSTDKNKEVLKKYT